MKKNVCTELKKLDRAQLEDLCTKVLGSDMADAKNDAILIDALMHRYKDVAKEFGIVSAWEKFDRNHIYGWASVFGLLVAVFALFWEPSAPEALAASEIDDFTRSRVHEMVRSALSKDPIIQKKSSSSRVWVDKVPEDVTTSGFELMDYSVMFDLRAREELNLEESDPADRDALKSPVVQTIRKVIRNIDGADRYSFRSSTSGVDVFARSSTHEDRMKVFASHTERQNSGLYLTKPRVIELNVSKDPKDRDFIIEITKTFWNSFQTEKQSWAGLYATVPMHSISILALFPKDKPATKIEYFAHNQLKNRIDLPNEKQVIIGPHGSWVWWRIVEPIPGYGYAIDWEW